MTVHGIGREEREREGKKEVTFVFFPWEIHIHEAIIIRYTRTRAHTRHSSKVENNESEICKIQETISVCVCIQYGWSV